jgi:uncharacterized circularly permuted ATP-grasp superfamily protein
VSVHVVAIGKTYHEDQGAATDMRQICEEVEVLPMTPGRLKPHQFAETVDRLDGLVVKGRGGSGGHEVVIVEELDGDAQGGGGKDTWILREENGRR